MEPPGAGPPRTPRWVKIIAAVGLLLLLALLIVLLVGGDHGPGRHASGAAGLLAA